MLELNSLSVTLDTRSFEYTLQVAPGEILVILGPSGSGKSTLLNLVGGFLQPQSGSLTWCGESLLNKTPDQRPVTTLFQKNNLFAHLTVWQNMALGVHPGAKLDNADSARLLAALDRVGLSGYEKRMPSELSGGEQQRVALARSLLSDKKVLLLDEPYSAIDSELRKSMLVLTRSIVSQNQLATLLVTHEKTDAHFLDAHVARLQHGRLEML